MNDLHYATCANEKHAAVVSTWTEDDGLFYRMTLDGKVIDEGVLALVDEDGNED